MCVPPLLALRAGVARASSTVQVVLVAVVAHRSVHAADGEGGSDVALEGEILVLGSLGDLPLD